MPRAICSIMASCQNLVLIMQHGVSILLNDSLHITGCIVDLGSLTQRRKMEKGGIETTAPVICCRTLGRHRKELNFLR